MGHGPGAEAGPTSLKSRSRLEGLKLAGIPIMTTSTTAKKKFRVNPFEGMAGNTAPLTAMFQGGMLSTTLLAPSGSSPACELTYEPACQPERGESATKLCQIHSLAIQLRWRTN